MVDVKVKILSTWGEFIRYVEWSGVISPKKITHIKSVKPNTFKHLNPGNNLTVEYYI